MCDSVWKLRSESPQIHEERDRMKTLDGNVQTGRRVCGVGMFGFGQGQEEGG